MKRNTLFALAITALLAWMGITITRGWHFSHEARAESAGGPQCPSWRSNPLKVPGINGAKTIAFQGSHLVALNGDGQVWSYYAEGGATCETRAVAMDPARYASKDGGAHGGMARLAGSADYAAGLTSDGTLVTWMPRGGYETCGAGMSADECSVFVKRNVNHVSDVADSGSHMLLVTNDGHVLSAGMNDCGQLGHTELNSPPLAGDLAAVPGLAGIVAVASGKRSSMALDQNGRVWTWGNLSHPLVGSSSPTRPTLDSLYCGTSHNPFNLSTTAETNPTVVPNLPPVAAISSFHGFDLALDHSGRVWGWGYNDCGQLGGDPGKLTRTAGFQAAPAPIAGLPPIRTMAAGRRHAVFVAVDGSVWAIGDNEDAQLAMLGGMPSNAPTCVSSTERGGVSGYSATPRRIEAIPSAIAVAADEGHSAAVDSDGHVWIWGQYP
jgi:alpha-tubulin suppressor-like RCC1 family protein